MPQLLVEPGDQSRPQGSHGAGAANRGRLPVDENVVSGLGIGVAGDVGHALGFTGPAGLTAGGTPAFFW